MVSYTSPSNSTYSPQSAVYPSELSEPILQIPLAEIETKVENRRWLVFVAAIFLVSVPVFIQAPLVRSLPFVSLMLTIGLVMVGRRLLSQRKTQLWGDLLLGFTWTWLAGSLYWGWLRWEPFLHLPVEAIGLPLVLIGIFRQPAGVGRVGNFFYLGSLLGTVVTDVYFYLVDLIPYWRKLMHVGEELAQPIFQSAIAQIRTPFGIYWAIILFIFLLIVSLLPLRSQQSHWWAFSGAVLSTILVDGLFWLAACFA